MGKGTFYGGITTVIIGIIIVAGSAMIQGLGSYGVSRCDSLGGQLGQAFSQDQQEACLNMVVAQTGGNGLMMLGWGVLALGFVLTVVGAVQVSRRPARLEKDESLEHVGAPLSAVTTVFCRYCGRIRPVAGTNCSECGKATLSSITQIKKCNFCAASMSADSQFCANCGRSFASTGVPMPTTTGGGSVVENHCPHCGTIQSVKDNFCPQCGKRPYAEVAQERRCPKCSSEVKQDAVFCGKCGQSLT